MPRNWWAHISLFVVHGTSPTLPNNLIVEIERVKSVPIKGFALVSFGPIDYFKEISTIK